MLTHLLLLATLSASQATATAGDPPDRLTFTPAAPTAGATVRVEYRPAADPGMPRLVLRARLRSAADDSGDDLGSVSMATMRRAAGTYRGEFTLPASTVFAVFVVETEAGDRVDANSGRPWELMVHGSGGVPLPQALEQRFFDYMSRDNREILVSARELARLHPDHLQGWAMLQSAEMWTAGAAEREAVMASGRARAEALAARYRQEERLTEAQLEALLSLTHGTEGAAEWSGRMEREYPTNPYLQLTRFFAGDRELRSDPARRLALHEELWSALESNGPPRDERERHIRATLAGSAVRVASSSGDAETRARWVPRHLELAHPREIAYGYLRDPELREIGEEVARARIARLLEHRTTDRELGHTAEEQVRAQRLEAGYLQAAIGRSLLAAGDAGGAVRELEAAVRLEPAGPNYRALAEARSAAGDVQGALTAWASVAASREDRAALADSVRALFPDGFDAATWEARVAAIRAELLARTLSAAGSREIPDVPLLAADGSPTTLAALAGGEPTLVVFVSRYCGPSMQAMPGVQGLATAFAGSGVRVIPITADSPGADHRDTYAEAGVTLPIYHDGAGAAGLAFNNNGTPQYFVLDGAGRLRFEKSILSDVPLQLAALRGR